MFFCVLGCLCHSLFHFFESVVRHTAFQMASQKQLIANYMHLILVCLVMSYYVSALKICFHSLLVAAAAAVVIETIEIPVSKCDQ